MFKAVYDAYAVQAGGAMWLTKHYLSGCNKAEIKARVVLPIETAKYNEGCLAYFFAIVNYLLNQFKTHIYIAKWKTIFEILGAETWRQPTMCSNYGRRRLCAALTLPRSSCRVSLRKTRTIQSVKHFVSGSGYSSTAHWNNLQRSPTCSPTLNGKSQ